MRANKYTVLEAVVIGSTPLLAVFVVYYRILFSPGYIHLGDFVPPFNATKYLNCQGFWNECESYANPYLSQNYLFSAPFLFYSLVLKLNPYLSATLWLISWYYLSIVMFELGIRKLTQWLCPMRRAGIYMLSGLVFSLNPYTIINSTVGFLLPSITGSAFFIFLLNDVLDGKIGASNLVALVGSFAMVELYLPNLFFVVLFGAVVIAYRLITQGERKIVLLRAGSVVTVLFMSTIFFFIPQIVNAPVLNGALQGISLRELYNGWSTKQGWSMLYVISGTRTALYPGFFPPSSTLLFLWLLIPVVSFLAIIKLVSRSKVVLATAATAALILLFAIRNHPMIDIVAWIGLHLVNFPYGVTLWNLLKQPNIFENFLPVIYGILVSCVLSTLLFRRTRIRVILLVSFLILLILTFSSTALVYSQALNTAFSPSPIPVSYSQVNDYFDAINATGRILTLPPNSFGGVMPKWSNSTYVSWPLYQGTPPGNIVMGVDERSSFFTAYIYWSIMRGYVHDLGAILSSLGISYLIYYSDYVIPGLPQSADPNLMISHLNAQKGISLSFSSGSVYVYKVNYRVSQVYLSKNTSLLVGDLGDWFNYSDHGFNFTTAPVMFAYDIGCQDLASALQGTNYVLLGSGESLESLVLLINCRDQVNFAASSAQNSEVVPVTTLSNFLVQVFSNEATKGQILLSDSGFVMPSDSYVEGNYHARQSGLYDIWVRISSLTSAPVTVSVGNISFTAQLRANPDFMWYRIGSVNLANNTNYPVKVVSKGTDVLNTVIVIPSSAIANDTNYLNSALASKQVYRINGTNVQTLINGDFVNSKKFRGVGSVAYPTYSNRGSEVVVSLNQRSSSIMVLSEIYNPAYGPLTTGVNVSHLRLQYFLNAYQISPIHQDVVFGYKLSKVYLFATYLSLISFVVSTVIAEYLMQKKKHLKRDK